MVRRSPAAVRRVNRLMRPAKATKAARSLHKAMTGLMLASALAPLAVFAPATEPLTPKTGRNPTGAAKTSGGQPGASGKGGRKGLPRMPAGARFLARTHRCAAGSRAYKLYLPESEPDHPKGLIVMLHGCNQTPDDFAIGTHMNGLAETHGLAIAYPAQSRRRNAAGCWNWFQPAHQVRGMGEPAILASLTRKLMRELRLGREAVFVAGLSSGGAMAAILADVYPDVFSGAGIHSGMARGAATGAMTAMAAMRVGASGGVTPARIRLARPVRWIIFQGVEDATVHP
jgi:poly(hydroxyalkanoate) depolymerase family esterase